MNLNSKILQAMETAHGFIPCDGCMDEAKRQAKREFFKERKRFMCENGNDVEGMSAFESRYDLSRFLRVHCVSCRTQVADPKVICTPINHKLKKTSPCSHTDFNEQTDRNKHILDGDLFWQWDDGPLNQAKPMDYFGFWVFDGQTKGEKGQWRSGHFIFHRVLSVCNPNIRLPSWHKNVGHSHRNVLVLSPPKLTLTYDQMIAYGARPQYHGTKYYKSGFEKESPLMGILEQSFA